MLPLSFLVDALINQTPSDLWPWGWDHWNSNIVDAPMVWMAHYQVITFTNLREHMPHTEFCLPSRETTKPHGPFYGWGVKTECAKCFDWQEKGEHSTQCNLLSQTVPTPLNEALLWNECVTLSLHLHAAGDAENVYMFFFYILFYLFYTAGTSVTRTQTRKLIMVTLLGRLSNRISIQSIKLISL